MSSRVLLSLGLLQALGLAQRTLLVGPGEAFTEIQPAIDAAFDGDRILVRTGVYNATGPQPIVVNKGVAITCERNTAINFGVRFSGIGRGQQASLANASVTGGELPGVRTLSVIEVLDCDGVVAVSQCGLFAGATRGDNNRLIYASDPVVRAHRATLLLTTIYIHGGYGTPVIDAASSTLQVSYCFGARGSAPFYLDLQTNTFLYNGPVPPTMRFADCRVSMSDGYLSGGDGRSPLYAAGGDALQLTNGELHLVRSTVNGGAGFGNLAGPGGPGGNGIVHNGTLVVGTSVNVAIGPGGFGSPPGAGGQAIVGPALIRGPIPGLRAVTSVVALGGLLRLEASVAPGAFLYLGLSPAADPVAWPGLGGLSFLRFDVPFFAIGPRPVPSGTEILEFAVPADPTWRGITVFAQAAAIDPDGAAAMFSAAALVGVGF